MRARPAPFVPALLLLSAVAVGQTERAKRPEPTLHRCDLDLERALDAAAEPATNDDRTRIQRVVERQRGLYRLFGIGSPEVYARFLTTGHKMRAELDAARKHFAGRDVGKDVVAAYHRTCERLGRTRPRAPDFWLFHAWSRSTNARTQGSGKPDEPIKVFLNLPALARGRHFEAAIVHESVHTLQAPMRAATLLDRAAHEGVATYVSLQLVPGLSKPDAMFWPKASWDAAEQRRDAIVAAFAERRSSSKDQDLAGFVYLAQPLVAVPGAPDRCGYYVGLLMAEAWTRANPKRPLGDLLDASPTDLWKALATPR
jgi:hypothetical protein